MKNLLKSFAAVVALASSLPTSASVIDVEYLNEFVSRYETVWVSHSVSGGPFSSALLTIVLQDDNDIRSESFLTIGLGHIGDGAADTSYTFSLGSWGIAQLNVFGGYSYSLTSTRGDFWFKRSILSLEPLALNLEPAAVREPGTLMLLGAGLVGIALVRRRRKRV